MTVDSPTLLTHYEHCQLDGFWSRNWQRAKLEPNEMIQAGLKAALTSERKDFGQAGGEHCYQLGADPGLDSKQYDIHSQVVHLAALADVISHAIRKAAEPPWRLPEPVKLGDGATWRSAAFLSPNGAFLRRVVLVTSWSDDRHYHEARSFYSLGEVCVYGLPMQQAVIVLGAHKDGRRLGPLSKGLLHPKNRTLRFRKRNDVGVPFKDSWFSVWREDHNEFSTAEWLDAMLEDGVLQDSCFSVEIPVPEAGARGKIVDLIGKKLDALAAMEEQPEGCLSVCDWPIPCPHRAHCHSGNQPSGKYGFVRAS